MRAMVTSDSLGKCWTSRIMKTSHVISSILTFGAFVVANAEVSCPSNWILSEASGTCIKFCEDKLNWDNARGACQTEGGDLVKIINTEMNQFIADELVPTGGNLYWIGLHDLESDGLFVWLDEETEAENVPWLDGQPEPNQDCVYFDDGFEAWGDYQCYASLPYICGGDPTMLLSAAATTFIQTSAVTSTTTDTQLATLSEVTGAKLTTPVYTRVTESREAGLSAGVLAGVVLASLLVLLLPAAIFSVKLCKRRWQDGPPRDSVAFVKSDFSNELAVKV